MRFFPAIMAVVSLGAGLAGCTPAEQQVAGYGATGAALGAIAGGAIGGTGTATLTGAAAGAVAGGALGARTAKPRSAVYCKYVDPYGRIYEAPCSPYRVR
ncbi:hypothetical protein [Bartonella sp. DGB2]|uniref:hypothetical protein n=1 Tax=Bartonella sp. DGB2 TaxID=3388426 RepID=UPI00398FB8A4